jgi:ABC-2 type transport system ATP-binding protein
VLTDQSAAAALALTALGLTEVSQSAAEASGQLGSIAPEKVVAGLVHEGVPVRGFAVEAPSLEDMFVSLTGEGFDVSA